MVRHSECDFAGLDCRLCTARYDDDNNDSDDDDDGDDDDDESQLSNHFQCALLIIAYRCLRARLPRLPMGVRGVNTYTLISFSTYSQRFQSPTYSLGYGSITFQLLNIRNDYVFKCVQADVMLHPLSFDHDVTVWLIRLFG